MSHNRRDLIKSAIAVTLLGVSKASAQPARKPRRIGIVHSTELDDDSEACFLEGLRSQGWDKQIKLRDYEAKGEYGGTHARDRLKKYIRLHGKVDVIVVAGGVASRTAALEELATVQIPFVYLSGTAATPASSTANGKYCGVILDTFARYKGAIDELARQGADASKVFLVQNFNSLMTADEQTLWRTLIGATNRDFRFFDPATTSTPTTPVDNNASAAALAGEVAKLKAMDPKGVVVSPDPFFRLNAGDFRDAMANLNTPSIVPVCYPFKDFMPFSSPRDILLPNGAQLSTSSSDGAEIRKTAYYQLGLRAADVLDNTVQTAIPTATMYSTKWDGSTWVNFSS
jgi:hypothetical protein